MGMAVAACVVVPLTQAGAQGGPSAQPGEAVTPSPGAVPALLDGPAAVEAWVPLDAGGAAGDVPPIDGAAGAAAIAVRETPPPPPPTFFPLNPKPRCDVLDNFSDPRGSARRHQGTDILATKGQEVYAVADGVLSAQTVVGGRSSELSGNAWTLTLGDRTYYYYAHLSGFAPGLRVGSSVRMGQVIGYVGDTGNPGPGNYHLHFEVHPKGGTAVNPLPLLQIPSGCKVY